MAKGLAREILKIWLEAEFQGGRHQRRLEKIRSMEEEILRGAKQ
ncbi:MAG TPA: RpiB/LacA/LacB family sugar-phosphate isomerase [Thermodesulfobacteriota bacterium]|nr:RpiB/LacA/LacB family sugar-phosphate isomerase [Thermodesulfobacteriota bacterium]